MDEPPEGYTEPFTVYLVEYGDDREPPGWMGQTGGFTTEAEAERLRQRLIAEGSADDLSINMVAIHQRLEAGSTTGSHTPICRSVVRVPANDRRPARAAAACASARSDSTRDCAMLAVTTAMC
jgi:hypothetical protein